MSLPLAETLKIILSGPQRPVPRGSAPGGRGRLGELFRSLQADPAGPAAHAIEDDIWAIWIAHDDPGLESRMQQAIAAIAQRRLAEAEARLDALVAAAPGWAEAWNKRATLYYLTRRDAESIADIRRTLELEPRHFGAICGFGQICLRHGEVAAAAEAFAAALAINPHLDSVRAVLAQLAPGRPHRLN
jgi:tetratricopeptide (TPR) repeat protein